MATRHARHRLREVQLEERAGRRAHWLSAAGVCLGAVRWALESHSGVGLQSPLGRRPPGCLTEGHLALSLATREDADRVCRADLDWSAYPGHRTDRRRYDRAVDG